MVQFLSIIFFLGFLKFCWVFQKFPFFCVTLQIPPFSYTLVVFLTDFTSPYSYNTQRAWHTSKHSHSIKTVRCSASCKCLCLHSFNNFQIYRSIICKLFTNITVSHYHIAKSFSICDKITHFMHKFFPSNLTKKNSPCLREKNTFTLKMQPVNAFQGSCPSVLSE